MEKCVLVDAPLRSLLVPRTSDRICMMFAEEKAVPDNRARKNFVFLAYPFTPPLPADDYKRVVSELQQELPIRLWYFLDEVTTAELMRKIWRAILRADLAVFDVSRGNPNVAFELGLALAIDKRCMTLLKTGEPNPLGMADLGYAERMEYTSGVTLKDRLRDFIIAKSSAMALFKEMSFEIQPEGVPPLELQKRVTQLVTKLFMGRHLTKSQAVTIMQEDQLASWALYTLRAKGVLKVEGVKKGARWVFTDEWVYHDHEVAGA